MKPHIKRCYFEYLIALVFIVTLFFNCSSPTGGGVTVSTNSNGINGHIPLVVNNNPKLSDTLSRPAFDRFSWNTFIALNWPLHQDTTARGIPLNPDEDTTFLNMHNTTPVVWTSYKNQYDLYGNKKNRSRPTAWDSTSSYKTLCGGSTKLRAVFGRTKFNTLPVEEADEAFSVPLIDQDTNYVLYEIRYNKTHYDFVRGGTKDSTWRYLKKNLVAYQMNNHDKANMPASDTTRKNPQGALMMKAAWREVTDDEAKNYYVINEKVYDPISGTCIKKQLGLVGLHFAQKLKGFRQWVWSSFEHINNVPGQGSNGLPYSFNNNDSIPVTSNGFANKPKNSIIIHDKSKRIPVQVTRLDSIPTTPNDSSTMHINSEYQKRLAKTVWKNYQLVITQWPTAGDTTKLWVIDKGEYPEDAGTPFPAYNCVNTTMETYFQSRADARDARDGVDPKTMGIIRDTKGNSCMGCHYTAAQTDYSWSMQLRSYITKVDTPSFAKDIVPMFYQWRPQMLNVGIGLDLTDSIDLVSDSMAIKKAISATGNGQMPPTPYPKLTKEEINTYHNWLKNIKKN